MLGGLLLKELVERSKSSFIKFSMISNERYIQVK